MFVCMYFHEGELEGDGAFRWGVRGVLVGGGGVRVNTISWSGHGAFMYVRVCTVYIYALSRGFHGGFTGCFHGDPFHGIGPRTFLPG